VAAAFSYYKIDDKTSVTKQHFHIVKVSSHSSSTMVSSVERTHCISFVGYSIVFVFGMLICWFVSALLNNSFWASLVFSLLGTLCLSTCHTLVLLWIASDDDRSMGLTVVTMEDGREFRLRGGRFMNGIFGVEVHAMNVKETKSNGEEVTTA